MGEAGFNQFIRLRNQLVIAAEIFVREENLSSVLIPTKSKDLDEQLKLADKVVDVVDRANDEVCLTLLRNNVDKPKKRYAKFQKISRKMEEEKFDFFQVSY